MPSPPNGEQSNNITSYLLWIVGMLVTVGSWILHKAFGAPQRKPPYENGTSKRISQQESIQLLEDRLLNLVDAKLSGQRAADIVLETKLNNLLESNHATLTAKIDSLAGRLFLVELEGQKTDNIITRHFEKTANDIARLRQRIEDLADSTNDA